MKLNLAELEILERLLKNRLNADYDLEIDELERKISKEIRTIREQIGRITEWSVSNN